MIASIALAAMLQAAPPPRPPAPPLAREAARLRVGSPYAGRTTTQDDWLGSDKFQHFWASYAATSFVYAATRAAGAGTDTGLAVAIPVAFAAGLAKEARDRRLGGPFSVRDLVADALGIAAAYFFLREVR